MHSSYFIHFCTSWDNLLSQNITYCTGMCLKWHMVSTDQKLCEETCPLFAMVPRHHTSLTYCVSTLSRFCLNKHSAFESNWWATIFTACFSFKPISLYWLLLDPPLFIPSQHLVAKWFKPPQLWRIFSVFVYVSLKTALLQKVQVPFQLFMKSAGTDNDKELTSGDLHRSILST